MTTTTPDELTTLALWGMPADQGMENQNLTEVIARIAQALPNANTQERAALRHRLGYLALMVGDARPKALEAFNLMREGALKTDDKRLEALADVGLSTTYDFIGQRHEALEYARQAVQIAQVIGDQRLLALALNSEAQFYKENGENERAFELYQRIEAIGQAMNDSRLIMAALIGMGRTTPMSQSPRAISRYEKAMEMAQAAGDEGTLVLCYNNLSDWMIYTERYSDAITLREKCLELARKRNARPEIGRALIGLAKAYTLLGETDKARALLNQGFPTAVSAGDLEGDLHSSLNLAYLYVQTSDIPRATELYRQTLERSLAAPDHACAVFAQKALELLADGKLPAPGILPTKPEVRELSDAELETVVGGATFNYTYPTGDMGWHTGL